MGGLAIPMVVPRIDDPALEFEKYFNFLVALNERKLCSRTVSGLPIEAVIDLTTTCQLSCPYCGTGNGAWKRPTLVMKADTHTRILGALGDHLFITWYFSTGEPLLNRNLAGLVRETKGKQIFSSISTNLSLSLSDARIDDLLHSELGMISVSMDGASPETYVRYRRGGDFALVLGNMKRLAARKRALGLTYPLIEWRFLVFRHNHHEIDRAREMAAELGLDLLEFFYGYALAEGGPDDVLRWDGPIPGLPISGPAWDRGLQRRDTRLRAHLFPNSYSYSLPPPPASRSKKCDWLYFSTMLYPDAAAGPCCVAMSTSDDFGRLEPGLTFSELWNNPNYRNARDLFNGGGDRNLVCARCPMPGAMDYQFVTSLRAILLNAPDWVLTILGRSPEDFFHEVDFALFGKELEAVRAVAAETDPADAATLARLDAAGAQSAALAAHAARFKARLRDAAAAGRQDRVLQPAH